MEKASTVKFLAKRQAKTKQQKQNNKNFKVLAFSVYILRACIVSHIYIYIYILYIYIYIYYIYIYYIYIYIIYIYIKEFKKVYILKNVESLHLKIFNQNIKNFKVLTFQRAFGDFLKSKGTVFLL